MSKVLLAWFIPILPPPGYHNLRLWVRDACKHMHFHVVAVDPYSGNRSEIFIAAESCLPAMPRLQKGRLSLDTNFERYLQLSVLFFMQEMLITTWTKHVFLW